MLILILCICGVVLFFSVKAFKKYDFEFYETRKEFIGYLDRIKSMMETKAG